MRHVYTFHLSLDPAAILPTVKDLVTSVNNTMAGFGFDEKMGLRSQCLSTEVSANRELTKEELQIIENAMMREYTTRLPDWHVKLEHVTTHKEE